MKKEGWGGGGTRSVTFSRGSGEVAVLKASGRSLTVSVGDGLPKSSSESAQSWGRSQRGGSYGDGASEGGANQGCGGGASEAGPERVRAVEGWVERDVMERTRPRRGQGQRGNQ